MIRAYEQGDELLLKPNEFSGYGDCAYIFDDEKYVKHTLEDDGKIYGMVVWFEYEPNRWGAWLLISVEIGMKHVKELKRFISGVIVDRKPERIVTYSLDCEVINKWHEFLGFEMDGTDTRVIEGKNFNKWVLHGN